MCLDRGRKESWLGGRSWGLCTLWFWCPPFPSYPFTTSLPYQPTPTPSSQVKKVRENALHDEERIWRAKVGEGKQKQGGKCSAENVKDGLIPRTLSLMPKPDKILLKLTSRIQPLPYEQMPNHSFSSLLRGLQRQGRLGLPWPPLDPPEEINKGQMID